jgi:seryl-tRNA(Sec) selenium transferase
VNELEERLRKGNPPIITRIREDLLILDARTVQNKDIDNLVGGIRSSLAEA